MTALLIGNQPGWELGFRYTDQAPYDAVVIGSLTLGQLLRFREEAVLDALAKGMPVYLYTPGLPACGSRALSAGLASAQRELKSWGVVFTDGAKKQLITASDARLMREKGERPPKNAKMTPLAREILQGE